MTTLFSEAYALEQRRIHAEQEGYGSRGFNWGYLAAGIARLEDCHSILDYGCGKGTIGKMFRESGLNIVSDYDPAIKGKDRPPAPADLTIAVDVMEHIEPECLDAVLADLRRVTKKILFVAIPSIPSKRWMSDGRNTHLIQESEEFWRGRLDGVGFRMRRVWKTGIPEFVAMMNAPGNMRRI